MSTVHEQARALAQTALVRKYGAQDVELGEVKALAGVAWLETRYGTGWKGAGVNSNNLGAEQCGNWKGDRFVYIDTHPKDDGGSVTYRACFRKYATIEEGWRALVDIVYVNRGRTLVRAAARADDWFQVSQRLYTTGYYEGFGKTSTERVANHHRALLKAIMLADKAEGRVVIAELPTIVLRKGMRGPAVKTLQRELGLAADGLFGPITETTLKLYQRSHGLATDGVCGPLTWATLYADDYQPPVQG